MGSKTALKLSGLATSINPFTIGTDLACAILDNCVLRNRDMIEPLRGYTQTDSHPGGVQSITRVFPWKSRIMAFGGTSGAALADYSDGTGWSATYSQPASGNFPGRTLFGAPDASNPQRFASASKGLFLTTSTGVKHLDGLGNSVLDAGIPAPSIALCFATNTLFAVHWLASGNSVAYRLVLCRYDANGALIQSAPSEPAVATGSGGGALDVAIYPQLPANINGATFLQVYRTKQVAGSPGDEMYLVAEYALSSLNFNAQGVVTGPIIDQLDDNGGTSPLLGQALYTNPSEGGIENSNDQPPLAKDICSFNGSLILANTVEPHSVSLRLIGTGGLSSGTSTIVIGGVTYKADAATDATTSPPTFQLTTGGSAAANIDATARALVSVVNQYNYAHGGGVQALYLSTPDIAPGIMEFVEAGVGGNSFTVHAGQDGQICWSPDLSKASYVQTSNNNATPGKVWWSWTNQPWAVNADSWEIVGEADQDVLRIMKLRNTVFVFKKDGLFTLTGKAPPFDTQPFDPTLVLLAPESCALLNGQIYCLTNRGWVYVSESGVTPSLSWPIERDLQSLEASFSNYATASFAVPYENEGLVFLGMPTSASANCPEQYVFNAGNPGWSRQTMLTAQHGCFDPARKALCWAVGSTLYEERKQMSGADHQLPSLTGSTVGSPLGRTVAVTGATVAAGDVLTQSGFAALVLSVNGSTCTIDTTHSFSAGNVTVLKAIPCHIRFLPYSGGDPAALKVWQSTFFALRAASFELLEVGFNSERTPTFSAAKVSGPNAAGLADQDIEVAQFVCRADVPQAVGESAMLGLDIQITQAVAFWQLQAVRIDAEPGGKYPVR